MLQNILKLYTFPCIVIQGIAFLGLPEVTKIPVGSALQVPLPPCLLHQSGGAIHGLGAHSCTQALRKQEPSFFLSPCVSGEGSGAHV